MAARGAEAKEKIVNQILASFQGSFKYDKEIRIPVMENGELIQIKVTLTAAKTNVDMGGDTAMPGENLVSMATPAPARDFTVTGTPKSVDELKPSEEEKQNMKDLLTKLGL